MKPLDTILFRRSAPFTLGVELEFQILDADSLDLVAKAPAMLESVPEKHRDRLKPEFIRSMVEINTPICTSVQEAEQHLIELSRLTEQLAQEQGCVLMASSLHPFARSGDQLLSSHPRYHRIMDDLQLVGRRFITQGLHVHVGLPDGDTAIRVCDNIRLFLPILLALTTSSPFYEGQDTGLHSYRAKLFEALPLAGVPDHLGTWASFERMATLLFQTGIINEVRDLWWDVRPHPDFGTIEIRICDLPTRLYEIMAIVALIQAVVMTLADPSTKRNPNPNMQVLRSNKWQAARYGLQGRFVDPRALRRMTVSEAAVELIELVRPAAVHLGTTGYFAPLDDIIANGTSADRQRQCFRQDHSFRRLITTMQQEFWQ